MKKLIQILCTYLFLTFSLNVNIYSQDECGTQDFSGGLTPYANDFFGGYYKPERTDLDDGDPSPSGARLNMLFVFVQFSNENVESGEWPIGDTPVFKNKLLVKDKNPSGDFWNRYRDSTLSDYYQELSIGNFHVTGITRHLITYHTWNYYKDTVGYNGLLTEIYTRLSADNTIPWTDFDLWSRNDGTNKYVYERDKYLDMMGIFFRSLVGTDFIGFGGEIGKPGFVPLHGPDNYVIYANGSDTVKIGANRDKFGSGFIVKGTQGPLSHYRSMGTAIHEYGHYLFSNTHSTTGIMTSN